MSPARSAIVVVTALVTTAAGKQNTCVKEWFSTGKELTADSCPDYRPYATDPEDPAVDHCCTAIGNVPEECDVRYRFKIGDKHLARGNPFHVCCKKAATGSSTRWKTISAKYGCITSHSLFLWGAGSLEHWWYQVPAFTYPYPDQALWISSTLDDATHEKVMQKTVTHSILTVTKDEVQRRRAIATTTVKPEREESEEAAAGTQAPTTTSTAAPETTTTAAKPKTTTSEPATTTTTADPEVTTTTAEKTQAAAATATQAATEASTTVAANQTDALKSVINQPITNVVREAELPSNETATATPNETDSSPANGSRAAANDTEVTTETTKGTSLVETRKEANGRNGIRNAPKERYGLINAVFDGIEYFLGPETTTTTTPEPKEPTFAVQNIGTVTYTLQKLADKCCSRLSIPNDCDARYRMKYHDSLLRPYRNDHFCCLSNNLFVARSYGCMHYGSSLTGAWEPHSEDMNDELGGLFQATGMAILRQFYIPEPQLNAVALMNGDPVDPNGNLLAPVETSSESETLEESAREDLEEAVVEEVDTSTDHKTYMDMLARCSRPLPFNLVPCGGKCSWESVGRTDIWGYVNLVYGVPGTLWGISEEEQWWYLEELSIKNVPTDAECANVLDGMKQLCDLSLSEDIRGYAVNVCDKVELAKYTFDGGFVKA